MNRKIESFFGSLVVLTVGVLMLWGFSHVLYVLGPAAWFLPGPGADYPGSYGRPPQRGAESETLAKDPLQAGEVRK
jgi:hypothetical protein